MYKQYKVNISSFFIYLYIMWRKSLFHVYLKRFQEFYFAHRTIPTMEECKDILSLSSKSSIHNFFQELIWAWYLIKKEWRYYPADRLTSIPFFESIQAWEPSPASDEISQEISLERFLIQKPFDTIFIKVIWESMIDAGIHEWDGIIVEKWWWYTLWDMIVAIVDQEYTVKYIQKDKQWNLFLQPANNDFSPIYPQQELQIFGKVTWVFRKY